MVIIKLRKYTRRKKVLYSNKGINSIYTSTGTNKKGKPDCLKYYFVFASKGNTRTRKDLDATSIAQVFFRLN